MRRIFVPVSLAMVLLPAHSFGGPLTQDECPGGLATPALFKQLDNDVLENLLFSHDSLWVSDGTRSSVLRLDPSGAVAGGLSGISSPGGLAEGPDGRIYAGRGNALAQAVLRTAQARVDRFDPADPAGSLEIYARGFSMPNGMTFGPDGALYISNDFDYGLLRIEVGSALPRPWSELAHVWGTNGLVVDPAGENLYAAITFDQRSPIERIPLAAPQDHATAAELSFGVLSLEPGVHAGDPSKPLLGVKGLDDMTRDDEGRLYVVANGTGELLKVDPATGAACLAARGFRNPSSVRIAPEVAAPAGFADGDPGTLDLYVTEFSGAIRVVRLAQQ